MSSIVEHDHSQGDLSRRSHVLITGGAGFIGTNLAAHLLATTSARITLLDNLSHPGAELNLAWLRSQTRASRLKFIRCDVCSAARVIEAVRDADEVYHLAARCDGPSQSRADFNVNVTGTLNVLEAARCCRRKPMVLYVSTRAAADRYVLDYAHLYHLPTVVLRPDSVAGARQFENEGHGWVAHLVYSVLAGHPITVYGDGMQVREVLHVSDLVEALAAARDFGPLTAGGAYNLGGGPSHCISVNEMIALIERVCYKPAKIHHAPARPDDRPYYRSDSSAFMSDTGWRPRRSLAETVRDIAAFWHANQEHMVSAPPLATPLRLPSAA